MKIIPRSIIKSELELLRELINNWKECDKYNQYSCLMNNECWNIFRESYSFEVIISRSRGSRLFVNYMKDGISFDYYLLKDMDITQIYEDLSK